MRNNEVKKVKRVTMLNREDAMVQVKRVKKVTRVTKLQERQKHLAGQLL
jgi:hypothetical protein